MVNILTAAEGAVVLRCEATDSNLLQLLPLVDQYIEDATGRAWQDDSTIHATAKSAARMLLVIWHENPAMIGSGISSLDFGLKAALVQLTAEALKYPTFFGLCGAGSIMLPGARAGETVESVTGLIGVTGDQSAAFESWISVNDEIQQVSSSDLSECFFRVHLEKA